MRRIAGILVLMATVAPSAAFAQRGGWWDGDWSHRRVMKAARPAGVEADEPAAFADFDTHGHLNPDGSDVRVIARGKEVPHRVLTAGPGDRVSIAFQLPGDTDTFAVYYGNPKAAKPTYEWEIRAGVLLEVRRYRGGNFANLPQAEATWQHSGDVMGRAFVGRVFLGHNPFGESGAVMSRYTGWLRIDRAGSYEFATTSTNASFLLIDGKEVVSWPGWHGAARRARRTGTIDLKPGRYKLEYLHIHPGGDDPVAVAAWQPPGAPRPVVIPDQAFLPVAEAVVQPEQDRGGGIVPDFLSTRREALLDPDANRYVFDTAFRDVTASVDRKYYQPLWDFGDGITASVWEPAHVYLAPGLYTVRYELRGPRGNFVTTQRLAVGRDWSLQASTANEEDLKRTLETVKDYDFTKMPAASVAGACDLFERLGRWDDCVRVGRTLVFEMEGVDGRALFDGSRRLARLYVDKMRKPAEAVAALVEAERKLAAADDWRAQLANEAGGLTLELLDDVDRAAEHYGRAFRAYKGARPETKRRTLMGLAEVAIFRTDADEARKRLAEADAIPIRRPEQGGDAVRVGSLSRAVEDYIRRKEFDSALELLDTWEWEYPLDRLAGYATILRAKLHLTRLEYPRALKLLTSLVKVNPRSNYAPEALMIAAEGSLKTGDKTKARDTYKRVMTEYPESPWVKDALKQVEALGR